MIDKNQPEYFVSFEEPFEFRKNLLSISRDVIVSMQKYERFKVVRIKKYENVTRLKHVMDEIYNLMIKLKDICPIAGIREKPVSEFISKIHQRHDYLESDGTAPTSEDYKSDLTKLEKELSHIEKQMNTLS